MKITGDWLDAPHVQNVLSCLTGGGHAALLVGGCVRNALLGLPVGDIDIATDARPDQVRALADACGFKCVPTGVEHGTVTVVADGVAHEVTTFRRDVQTDGRRAVVAFSDDLAEDAARRDFTMNALYADAAGTVVDPLGGLADLRARRVRFVGAPEERIREDYLRILRFFRFHATYGDAAEGPDAEGLAACAALADELDRLSQERIGHEVRRLLAAPDPAPAVAAMQAGGILARVLPGADGRWLAPLVMLEDGAAGDWTRRLAALGGEEVAERLRLSRAEARRLGQVRAGALSSDAPAVLGFRLGEGLARDAILVRAALAGTALPPGWHDEAARGVSARFPVRAQDLAPLAGEALGTRLRQLEQRWLDSGLRLSREQLLT